jgi:transposase
VGIDVAKDRHHAFFGTANGHTLLRRLLFDNNRAGLDKLLAHWLQRQGQLLVQVSNHAIAENRQTLDGRWDKNDTKDSANVADLVS